MRVRNMKPGEEPVLWDLFRSTIRKVNIRDYSESQVRAWASDEISSDIWFEKMRAINPFVVEVQGKIAGYSDLQHDGLIDHFFVHYEWQRRGVGRMLMQEIELRQKDKKLTRLEAHVSITARPFFESFGFSAVRKQQIEVRGAVLSNYVMQRSA